MGYQAIKKTLEGLASHGRRSGPESVKVQNLNTGVCQTVLSPILATVAGFQPLFLGLGLLPD